jgi:hypothetical protein
MAVTKVKQLPRALKPPAHPIYIRLPAPGQRCPFTSMSRSGLADKCVPNKSNNFKPPVRSVYLKANKHSKRGVRLIDFQSLMNYIKSEFAAQEASQIAP